MEEMKLAAGRSRNKTYYRALHVPIWIWVFFTLPGALTADLYEHGPDWRHGAWLAAVAAVCVWRGWRGRLPGAEPRPYITHYGVDLPNLPYRVVCYTAAWIDIVVPWAINLAGLCIAVAGGGWVVRGLYGGVYDALALGIVAATAANLVPRARRSIRNEGVERGWFYVGVWTAVPTQAAAWAMWRLGPALGVSAEALPAARLAVFIGVSVLMLALGTAQLLPRTWRYDYRTTPAELRSAAGE